MKKVIRHLRLWVLVILTMVSVARVADRRSFADEGMWTFDNPPLKQLKERYGFVPTQEWLDHVRRYESSRGNN